MRRYKLSKKGHLLIEVVVYLSVVSLVMMCAMNIGNLILRENKNSGEEAVQTLSFISLDERLKGIIEKEKAVVSVVPETPTTKKQIEVYTMPHDRKDKNIFIYFENGKIKIKNEPYVTGGSVNGQYDIINIGDGLVDMKISEDKKLIYIEYIFEDEEKLLGVYEK